MSLAATIAQLRRARLITIGYGFHAAGGAWKSIHHLHTHLEARGDPVLLIARPWRRSGRRMLAAFLFGRRVLINALDSFYSLEALLFCLLRRDTILYLHETRYIFEQFRKHHPWRFVLTRWILRRNPICCVSRQQEAYLREEFGARFTHVLYENIVPPRPSPGLEPGLTHVVMIGSVDARKGAALFSATAELAHAQGRPWRFSWIGPRHGAAADLPLSPRVAWLGPRSDIHPILEQTAVFFLSSVDDPFPLACLEALSLHRKCVVYRQTGLAEVLDGVSGCAVYERHEPEAALAAIDKAMDEPLDIAAVDRINTGISSVEAFAGRMDALLDRLDSPGARRQPASPP